MHTKLRDGGDQPLVHVPAARVTSASYSIEDVTRVRGGADRVLDTGDVTRVELGEVTTAECGVRAANPRLIAVAGSAAVVGHTYEIQDPHGMVERFEVEAVSSTGITVKGRMSGHYPEGSVIRDVELLATLPASVAADTSLGDEERPLRVVWSYTIDGQPRRAPELIRLSHNSDELPQLPRVEARLRETHARLVQNVGHALGAHCRAAAVKLTAYLQTHGLTPSTFYAGPQGFECLVQAAFVELVEMTGWAPSDRDPDAYAETLRIAYFSMRKGLVKGPGVNAAEVNRTTDQAHAGHRRRRRPPINLVG